MQIVPEEQTIPEEKVGIAKPSKNKLIIIASAVIGILLIILIFYFVFREPSEVIITETEEPVQETFEEEPIDVLGDYNTSAPKIDEIKIVVVEEPTKLNITIPGTEESEAVPFDLFES